MDGLTPDDKTISNFRKDNAGALKETFREFVLMCRGAGLYGGELIATDSTKFRANNSLKNTHNEIVVKNELGRIDKRIKRYMEELEEADKEEAGERTPSGDEIRAVLERLKEQKDKYERLKERVENEGEVSTVDPDARLMHGGGDGRPVDSGYNVQTVVDSKNHLIVDFELTNNSCDSGNLHKMSQKAMRVLEVKSLTNLADKGYYSSNDLAACEDSGVTCLVAKRKAGGVIKTKEFSNSSFIYIREKDVYLCPCGNAMGYKYTTKKNRGKPYRRYVN
jgi:hypothetical protein